MKSYAAVRAQIAQLEKEAEDLRKAEVKKVIAQVREAIATYDLSAADLGFRGVGKGPGKPGAVKRAGAGVPKYRDPKSGKTWTGHGKPPGWIASARNRDAFLIDKSATNGEGAATATSATKAAVKKAAAKKPAAKAAKKSQPALKRASVKAAASKKVTRNKSKPAVADSSPVAVTPESAKTDA